MSIFLKKVLTQKRIGDILLLHLRKVSKEEEMIFENWAKCQYLIARKKERNLKKNKFFLESLILAQDKRWRHA